MAMTGAAKDGAVDATATAMAMESARFLRQTRLSFPAARADAMAVREAAAAATMTASTPCHHPVVANGAAGEAGAMAEDAMSLNPSRSRHLAKAMPR
jgi:hypothetical protein